MSLIDQLAYVVPMLFGLFGLIWIPFRVISDDLKSAKERKQELEEHKMQLRRDKFLKGVKF